MVDIVVIKPHTSVAGSSLLISLTVSTVTYSGAGSSLDMLSPDIYDIRLDTRFLYNQG